KTSRAPIGSRMAGNDFLRSPLKYPISTRIIAFQTSVGSRYTSKCVVLCVEMATNLDLDEKLLNEALKVGGNRTKKATVEEALEEYIQRRKQQQVLKLFGKIDYDSSYNYKSQRRRDSLPRRHLRLVLGIASQNSSPE